MLIGIQAWGTDGDIEPLVSISVELANRGHAVYLDVLHVKNRDYALLNSIDGLNVRILRYPVELFEQENPNQNVEIWQPGNGSDFLFLRYNYIHNDIVESCKYLCSKAQFILGNQHTLMLRHYSEIFDRPYFTLSYEHSLIRSKFFSPPGHVEESHEKNCELWDSMETYINDTYRESVNLTRKSLGLSPVNNILQDVLLSKHLNLISYSEALYPRNPADWDGRHYTCGYIDSARLYSNWSVPDALTSFISKHQQVVFICFGNASLYENDLKHFQNFVIKAVQNSGAKAVYLSDWTNNSEETDGIYKLSGFVYLPTLIKECAAIIHACGTGFTHYAALAGVPSICVPYGMDQFYNAGVLKWNSLCKTIIPRVELNVANLGAAIQDTLRDQTLKIRARELAKYMFIDRGAVVAVDRIEEKVLELTDAHQLA